MARTTSASPARCSAISPRPPSTSGASPHHRHVEQRLHVAPARLRDGRSTRSHHSVAGVLGIPAPTASRRARCPSFTSTDPDNWSPTTERRHRERATPRGWAARTVAPILGRVVRKARSCQPSAARRASRSRWTVEAATGPGQAFCPFGTSTTDIAPTTAWSCSRSSACRERSRCSWRSHGCASAQGRPLSAPAGGGRRRRRPPRGSNSWQSTRCSSAYRVYGEPRSFSLRRPGFPRQRVQTAHRADGAVRLRPLPSTSTRRPRARSQPDGRGFPGTLAHSASCSGAVVSSDNSARDAPAPGATEAVTSTSGAWACPAYGWTARVEIAADVLNQLRRRWHRSPRHGAP
jgi:hypothetical protein